MTPAAWFALAATNAVFAIHMETTGKKAWALPLYLGVLSCLIRGFFAT